MIHRKVFFFLLAMILPGISRAQDYHFSQFIPNLVHVNPAYVTLPVSGEIGGVYRDQWPGIPATFVTYGADVVMPAKMINSGIGISFLNDMQGSGVINKTSASVIYGYTVPVNNNWKVGAGIAATYVYLRFNADQLVFRSDILNELGYGYMPVTLNSYNKGYPDFSVGVIVRHNDRLSFGVSALHVTRPYDSFSSIDQSRLPVKYTAFVSGKLVDNSQQGGVSVEPAVFYSKQRQNQELIWGSSFGVADNFSLGGWFRQSPAFQFESFIASAGFSWDHYNISYSYDVNLKKIQFLSTKMAAHEVTFLYRFEYKERKSKKALCPAYQ